MKKVPERQNVNKDWIKFVNYLLINIHLVKEKGKTKSFEYHAVWLQSYFEEWNSVGCSLLKKKNLTTKQVPQQGGVETVFITWVYIS